MHLAEHRARSLVCKPPGNSRRLSSGVSFVFFSLSLSISLKLSSCVIGPDGWGKDEVLDLNDLLSSFQHGLLAGKSEQFSQRLWGFLRQRHGGLARLSF